MGDVTRVALAGLDRGEVSVLLEGSGEPSFRVQQVLDAVYRQRVESVERFRRFPSSFVCG